jgi:hypothetical protein
MYDESELNNIIKYNCLTYMSIMDLDWLFLDGIKTIRIDVWFEWLTSCWKYINISLERCNIHVNTKYHNYVRNRSFVQLLKLHLSGFIKWKGCFLTHCMPPNAQYWLVSITSTKKCFHDTNLLMPEMKRASQS